MKRAIPILALLITLFLFATIVLVSFTLEGKRQRTLDQDMQRLYNSLNEMQISLLMSDAFDSRMACITYSSKLQELDKSVWDLGRKLDQYRAASEQFRKDPYYLEQKRFFNENEMLYLILLKKVSKECGWNEAIVLFFYQNAEDCRKCDDQSFILSDINREIDPEVSIFSFDVDLNITSIGLLRRYYEIAELPCVVINDEPFCGIRDKRFIMRRICDTTNVSICADEATHSNSSRGS